MEHIVVTLFFALVLAGSLIDLRALLREHGTVVLAALRKPPVPSPSSAPDGLRPMRRASPALRPHAA